LGVANGFGDGKSPALLVVMLLFVKSFRLTEFPTFVVRVIGVVWSESPFGTSLTHDVGCSTASSGLLWNRHQYVFNVHIIYKLHAQVLDIRPRTYPFFEDIYPIPYHGQKSDIISYPLSRQKKDRILYPILSNFFLENEPTMD
jgi:hypothetical protein